MAKEGLKKMAFDDLGALGTRASRKHLFQILIIGLVLLDNVVSFCECNSRKDSPHSTIILADGASGSTWLGQMLHQHHCSSSFVAQSTRLDGKVFVDDLGELSAMLKVNRQTHSDGGNGSAYGLVVPWQSMDKMLKQKTSHPHHPLSIPPFLVVVLLRDPFFWVLSQQKKLAIRDDSNHHRFPGVTCENMHQRGSKLCPISSDYRYSLSPLVLELRLYEFEVRTELMRSVGAASSVKWGDKNYFELDYAELLCAAKYGGRDALPRYLTKITGLGSCMQSKHIKIASETTTSSNGVVRPDHRHEGAVKTSPNSPAEELENLEELRIYAMFYNPKLLKYLDIRSETDLLQCEESLLETRSNGNSNISYHKKGNLKKIDSVVEHVENERDGHIKTRWAKVSIYNNVGIDHEIIHDGPRRINSKRAQLDQFNQQTRDMMLFINYTSPITVDKLGSKARLIFFENELKKIHKKYEELSFSLDREHTKNGYHTAYTVPKLKLKALQLNMGGSVNTTAPEFRLPTSPASHDTNEVVTSTTMMNGKKRMPTRSKPPSSNRVRNGQSSPQVSEIIKIKRAKRIGVR